jgi:cytochrome c5
MRKFFISELLFIFTLILACGTNVSKVTPEVSSGEKLYRSKCRTCHTLIEPKKFKDEEWKTFVEKYGSRAHLSVEDKEKILKYLMDNN